MAQKVTKALIKGEGGKAETNNLKGCSPFSKPPAALFT